MPKPKRRQRDRQRGAQIDSRPPAEKPRKPLFEGALPLVAVAGMALLLRLIAAHGIGAMPSSRMPHLDSLEYLLRARRIASGDFTWPVFPAHAPLYSFTLASLLFVTSGSLAAVRAIQSAIGALTCVLAALAGRRLFGNRSGLAAGLLLAVYAPLIWIDVSLLAEGLLMFFLAAMLWCIATDRHPLLTGAVLGLAALTRPTALIFVPLAIGAARTWRARALVAAAAIVVISPVTIINWRASHTFIPIQAYGGMNFYLGNSPHRDGTASARLGGDWERIEPEAARHGATTPFAEDHYFMQTTRTEIRNEPFAYVRLLLRKLTLTFQNEEVRDSESFYFYRQFAPLLRWLPAFSVLFALACAGMVLANWRERAPWIVAGYIVLSALTCVVLVVGARYRIPMAIGLALLGGLVFQRAPKRRAIAAAAVGLAAAGCTLLWHDPAAHDFAEEWALTARSLRGEGDAAGAERAARQAIAANPGNALGWDELGLALAAREDSAAAVEALQHAIAINGEFSDAHLHLGMIEEFRPNAAEAAAQYARAAQIDPRNIGAWQRLGDVELRRGNAKAAADAYGRVLALDPSNAGALFALARATGILGRAAEGLAIAQRARALREPTGDEWLMMGMLSLQSNRLDSAEEALSHAGENDPRVMFATALLRARQGRFDEASAILAEVVRRYPGFREAAALRQEIEARRSSAERPGPGAR